MELKEEITKYIEELEVYYNKADENRIYFHDDNLSRYHLGEMVAFMTVKRELERILTDH
jgi:hypothetical protein